MHPYQHSQTSVLLWGGEPEDYQPVHDWLDGTKETYCNFRHRALRHHTYGIQEAERIFGHTLVNSAGLMVPVRFIGEQHIKEDCGGEVPTLKDWFDHLTLEPWMLNPLETSAQAVESVQRWGGNPEDYIQIHVWLDFMTKDGLQLQAVRHHSQGIFEAERLFGHVLTNSIGRTVPVRYVCEQHIKRDFGGRIPSVSECLRNIPAKPWMSRGHAIAVVS